MDDTSQFLQWALSTLQHEQPPPAAAAYDNNGCDTMSPIPPVMGYSVDSGLVPGEPPAREGQRATNSWSSVDTDSGSGSGGVGVGACVTAWSPTAMCATTGPSSCSSGTTNKQSCWDFNSASAAAQQIIEPQPQPNSAAAAMAEGGGGGGVPQMALPTRRASAKISASSSSAPYSQDHTMAERKRREKINQRFIELSTVIPGLKKMDKATILSDATRYVRELQEKLKTLQEDGGCGRGRGMESAVLSKTQCIAAADGVDDDGARPYAAASGPAVNRNALPEIEATISDGNVVMVRVHCRDAKGVVVRLLAEVEELHLAITHTNVVQFSPSVLIINIIAKVEQGFNTTADDIVERLKAALHQPQQRVTNSAEQARSCC